MFDASAKCEGTSLNDGIYQGPKLQRDLFDNLLRFRRFPVAVVCDIAEMYLRIGLSIDDKPYHRFLWRRINRNQAPDIYEFDRVVFGVNSSPFQAQFVLQCHAQKYQSESQMAADDLEKFRLIQAPRYFGKNGQVACDVSLHTFVDASEDAYWAVVYSRCTYEDDSVSSTIVAAKTRVAPSAATSSPRLEIMAAMVGVRLTTRIFDVLELPMSNSCFWSDSLNVLWWIQGRSRKFKPFVVNRVCEIQSNTSPDQWRYVPTSLNPADILSRDMSATELVNCHAWLRDPECLLQSEDSWPVSRNFNKPQGNDEMKSNARSKQTRFRCR